MPDNDDNLPEPDDPDLGQDLDETPDGDDSVLAERYGAS